MFDWVPETTINFVKHVAMLLEYPGALLVAGAIAAGFTAFLVAASSLGHAVARASLNVPTVTGKAALIYIVFGLSFILYIVFYIVGAGTVWLLDDIALWLGTLVGLDISFYDEDAAYKLFLTVPMAAAILVRLAALGWRFWEVGVEGKYPKEYPLAEEIAAAKIIVVGMAFAGATASLGIIVTSGNILYSMAVFSIAVAQAAAVKWLARFPSIFDFIDSLAAMTDNIDYLKQYLRKFPYLLRLTRLKLEPEEEGEKCRGFGFMMPRSIDGSRLIPFCLYGKTIYTYYGIRVADVLWRVVVSCRRVSVKPRELKKIMPSVKKVKKFPVDVAKELPGAVRLMYVDRLGHVEKGGWVRVDETMVGFLSFIVGRPVSLEEVLLAAAELSKTGLVCLRRGRDGNWYIRVEMLHPWHHKEYREKWRQWQKHRNSTMRWEELVSS